MPGVVKNSYSIALKFSCQDKKSPMAGNRPAIGPSWLIIIAIWLLRIFFANDSTLQFVSLQ
jgi:hypothetical protein